MSIFPRNLTCCLLMMMCCSWVLMVLGQNDQPLILTKYLNNPAEGKKLSAVTLPGYNRNSYSGFFTVDAALGSNMFFWFFPAPDPKAPILVWLQGGPGASSMFGLFGEMGPFSVNPNMTLNIRQIAWTNKYSMIFIDNPVGSGFSFTQSEKGFVKNEAQVGVNLYRTLSQFYQIFEEFRPNDLYITGESYGGHYVPAAAHAIHQFNRNATKKINLKGIAVGNGLFELESQVQTISLLAFYLGMADEQQVLKIHEYEVAVKEAIVAKKYKEAFHLFDELLNGDFWTYGTYFFNITGSNDYFNVRDVTYPPNPFTDYLNLPDIKKRIHVGNLKFADYNSTVEFHLIEDVAKSVRPFLEQLLDNHYKVLIYNGQNDLIVSGPLCEIFLDNVSWRGAERFSKASKTIWKIKKDDRFVAGFVRRADNLHQVIVRDAGHMVPSDQPERGFDMITRFIENKPWTN